MKYLRASARTFVSTFGFCLLAANAWSLERLHVTAGETRTLGAEYADWVFDELVLEDGATLVLDSSVPRWSLEARRASIGNGVSIVGVGHIGRDGVSGASVAGQAKECRRGKAGGQAGHGGKGADGLSLSLALSFERLESLTIDMHGGDGGVGGNGGDGQKGGAADKCPGADGGAGGDGGDGGDGGNGGNVRILYSFLPDSGLKGGVGKQITVNNSAGVGGKPGDGGVGGKGAPGHYVNMRTLTGNKKWIAGGDDGPQGQLGKKGREGVKGQYQLDRDLNRRIDELLLRQQVVSPEAVRQSYQEQAPSKGIEKTLAEILKRLDALEKRSR